MTDEQRIECVRKEDEIGKLKLEIKALEMELELKGDRVTEQAMEISVLKESRDELLELIDKQADDEGLWFDAEYATESYLQVALRELHSRAEALKEKETK